MRALLSPIGSRGDIQPMLVLGSELRERGHEVSFATCPNFRELVASEGFGFLPIGCDSEATLREHAALAEQNPLRALPRQLALLRSETERQCSELLEVTLPHFDVVVGAGLSFAAHLLAERQRTRYAFVCYTLSGLASTAHPPAALPVFGLPRFANRALWSVVRYGFTRSVGEPLARIRERYGLAPDPSPWHTIHARQAILAQDAIMGDFPSDLRGKADHVPALSRAAGGAPLPAHVEAFLAKREARPVVYVGFGSMPTVERTRVASAVTAFCHAHGARALLFSAHAEDAQIALPERVLSVGSLDHAELFPRLDLVVHHGGAGTTATALRAGVPQLIVPHIVDQFFHGRRIAELGLGPVPVKKQALAERLLALSWAEISAARTRAQSVAKGLAASGAPAAADCLERLVSS